MVCLEIRYVLVLEFANVYDDRDAMSSQSMPLSKNFFLSYGVGCILALVFGDGGHALVEMLDLQVLRIRMHTAHTGR
ncbi:uncharacterized protein PHACADRAFT_266543 [Phanerochaete carnosa HHB-10118-sp]|uniref:Uncharacterized protein n=1 Tax=Phanerochaete carnosa (strain HHB-10118-sp) TaxID=650164 RepID=K5UF92_PHACS|nr:uncharacterized protein PHACADRAFT_266543 [Phanerochaete carnosa HHB-10118-sp]EKM48121.1 hypothetical protein PHACADRAFT_266543 [Phanerochaete carnosa HHB-10118-sp]